MEFDDFAIVLLETSGPDVEDLAVWDGHLAHWAALHETGEAIAAGPAQDEHVRGVCILRADVERARALAQQDPAVQAGVFAARVVRWRVPKGVVVHNALARLPHSVADASS